MGAWMNSLETRAPRNVLIVAMANKLAESHGPCYRAVKTTGQCKSWLLPSQT